MDIRRGGKPGDRGRTYRTEHHHPHYTRNKPHTKRFPWSYRLSVAFSLLRSNSRKSHDTTTASNSIGMGNARASLFSLFLLLDSASRMDLAREAFRMFPGSPHRTLCIMGCAGIILSFVCLVFEHCATTFPMVGLNESERGRSEARGSCRA